MRKIRFVILLFCVILLGSFDTGSELDESTRMLIFTSIEYDGIGGTKTTLEEWIRLRRNHFEFLKVECSEKVTFYKQNILDSVKSKYEVQIFKIPDDNSKGQSRYLIWYKDFNSEVWLRAAGYVENDLNLLFDYLRRQNVKKREIKSMIQEWIKSDKLFKEMCLDCIYNGYKKGNTNSDCFNSVFYIRMNDVSIGYDLLKEKELKSVFSRLPLHGSFNVKKE